MGLHIIAIKLKKPPERDIKEVISLHIKPCMGTLWKNTRPIWEKFRFKNHLKVLTTYTVKKISTY